MSESSEMTTVSGIMEKLRNNGYGNEFRITEKGKAALESGGTFSPEELLIVRVFRFEGISDPADMSVLYAVKTRQGHQGYILDAFGTYSDYDADTFSKFISQVPVEDREDQLLF